MSYYRADGIDYRGFYELCGYLGTGAMYVTPIGMICTGWVEQSSLRNLIQPDIDLDVYIQDTLDAAEYATGSETSKWGALRVKNGHPKPSPLKYAEVRNENLGPVYWERYERIHQALYRQYPDLICVANSTIGKESDDERINIVKLVNPKNMKVFDEHRY